MIDRTSFIYGLASGLVFAIIILSILIKAMSNKPNNLINQVIDKLRKEDDINGDRTGKLK